MSYGKTQVEAEKIALIDLRNAYKANNKFCQTHITLQDSDMLRIRSSTELLWFLGLSFCVVLYGFFTGHYFFIVMLLFRFIEGVSKFIQSYFVSIGKAMFGLKVTQRLNLLVYPLGVCSVLFGWIFALGGLLEWQIYAGFFLLVFLTYEYFLTIKTQNDTIQKFKRYLLEHPQVSQTKPQHR